MKFNAVQIAKLIDGLVEGDESVEVSQLAKIEEASTGSLTFLSNPIYTPYIYNTGASIAIVNHNFVPDQKIPETCTLIRVEDAYAAFAKLLAFYQQYQIESKEGIEQPSFIASTAQLGEKVYIGAFAYISEKVILADKVKIYPHAFIGENVTIGEGSVVYAGAKIYHDTVIGKDCHIHAGAVIGADGFGFAPNAEKEYKKVPQIGNVILKDHVDVGGNACIDRATIGSTIVEKGVKIDNLVQIAHNVQIGENTVIAAQTGIAGSTKIGEKCMFGGQVGIAGHLKIHENSIFGAQSGFGSNTKQSGLMYLGSPAFPVKMFNKAYVYFKQLPELVKRIDTIEQKANQK